MRERLTENQKVAADALLVLWSSETYHDASAQATQSMSDTGMQTAHPATIASSTQTCLLNTKQPLLL